MRALLHIAAACVALAALSMVALDAPVARWIATRQTYPALWDGAIALLEYPIGIAPYPWTGAWLLAAGAVATLAIDRLRPAAFAWLAVTLVHLVGRNVTAWLKFGTGRLRPTQWLARGGADTTWWHDDGFAFPSGHVTLFASVVLPIVVLYPRARPLVALAALPAIARVAVNAHFVSDVLAALALVCAWTALTIALLSRVRTLPRPPGAGAPPDT